MKFTFHDYDGDSDDDGNFIGEAETTVAAIMGAKDQTYNDILTKY